MSGIYTWEVKEYVKLWQHLHLRTVFSCSYETFISSLIAFRVVAKGMPCHATVMTVDLVLCMVYKPVLCVVWRHSVCLPWPRGQQHVSWLLDGLSEGKIKENVPKTGLRQF